jgi:hypothetical protein
MIYIKVNILATNLPSTPYPKKKKQKKKKGNRKYERRPHFVKLLVAIFGDLNRNSFIRFNAL